MKDWLRRKRPTQGRKQAHASSNRPNVGDACHPEGERDMTPQQMRLIRPLTRQHPAAQAVLTTERWPLAPLLFVCLAESNGETFAGVMNPRGGQNDIRKKSTI